MRKVIKRDGKTEDFDREKIVTAVEQAFISVDGELTKEAFSIAVDIANYVSLIDLDLSVEEIQNIVENRLMDSNRKDVARAYIIYRNERNKIRAKNSQIMKNIEEKIKASNVQNQNANVDEHSFGGRMGEVRNEVMREYALNYIISDMAKNNHLNNEIYIHDLDSYAVGMHNCLSIPFDKLLAEGFTTRQTDVRPAQSINTAFQLVAVIFQLQSLQQFGGVSATHLDWTMVPYVKKSFKKHFLEGLKYIDGINYDKEVEDLSIDSPEYTYHAKVYKYAMDMTEKELKQAVEGMYHNLNTLQSRSGNQLPFTSINYGTCTLPEGRMVIKALLEGSLKGVGRLGRTPIFPK